MLEVERGEGCCLSYKDTILKANHSQNQDGVKAIAAVAYPTKILFWKRITACHFNIIIIGTLLLILQRYYFESESQHPGTEERSNPGCCLSYKDTILKANHSGSVGSSRIPTAVAYPTKILFWKRITAENAAGASYEPLLLILQRYYFESESQPYSIIIHD